MNTAPRVLALVGDNTGPSLWRIFAPFAELQKHGIFAHWKHRDDPELLDPIFLANATYNFDAMILPRMSWANRLANQHWLDTIHRANMAVILEVDDDLFSPAVVDRMYNVFERERARGRAQLERERQMRLWLLDQVDGITVSSRRLAQVVSQYTTTPVEVIPNAIDVRWFRSTLRGVQRVVPPLTIGWAGGARYAEDLAPVAAAWHNIARRYPDVTFVVQGHMAEVLIDAVPADRVRRLAWLPLEQYPRALLNIDIGVCSVAPRPFNVSKSPIKLWEYTLAGAACVVSPTLYEPYVADGEDALVADTAAEWEAALARLVEDVEIRKSLRRAQRRRVACEHSLERNWQQWPIAWSHILDSFRASTSRKILVRTTA